MSWPPTPTIGDKYPETVSPGEPQWEYTEVGVWERIDDKWPSNPQTGDMVVWDGSEWVLFKSTYESLTSAETVTWDCKTGLNKKLTRNTSFTLKIENVVNGMSGDLVFNNDGPATKPTITLEAYTGGSPSASINVIGNGILTEIQTGVHHICWVYDGLRLTFNIARYAD